jgi:hypothetical protein
MCDVNIDFVGYRGTIGEGFLLKEGRGVNCVVNTRGKESKKRKRKHKSVGVRN